MVIKLYESLKTAENPREELIALKQELKQEEAAERLREFLKGDSAFLTGLLEHEDAKVRKNAALILGRLKMEEGALAIYQAYAAEAQRFVKADYLNALAQLAYEEYLPELEMRLRELEAYEPEENEKKHVREEMAALRKMVAEENEKRHRFTGYEEEYEVILTTGKVHQELLERQIRSRKQKRLTGGIRVKTKDIRELLDIPLYREILFLLDVRKIAAGPEQAAEELADSNLMEFLQKAHGAEGPFYFRLGIHGRMTLDKRSEFAKKCAFELEKRTAYSLKNSTSGYEIELRLMENRDGTFLPLVRLYTLVDKRFAYRKNTVASSIRPEQAALIAALGTPFLKEGAQVLDPFCGVGTMLLERDRICPAKTMYGIDIFGKAVAGARENAALAGRNIYFINRDFFGFTHEYLFDEIITNMPERGKKTKEEQDMFYKKFFQKAGEVLNKKGIILMYTNEKGFVKKQMRVSMEFQELFEYSMDEKDMYHLFIIGKRG